jgi:hypothetical protein
MTRAGRTIAQFERSTAPEQAGKGTLFIRILKIVDGIECIVPNYNGYLKKPTEGSLLVFNPPGQKAEPLSRNTVWHERPRKLNLPSKAKHGELRSIRHIPSIPAFMGSFSVTGSSQSNSHRAVNAISRAHLVLVVLALMCRQSMLASTPCLLK